MSCIFIRPGSISLGPRDLDGFRLYGRLDTRAGVMTISGNSFGQGGGKISRAKNICTVCGRQIYGDAQCCLKRTSDQSFVC